MTESKRHEPGTIFWDFDGTLAWREGLWRGCLLSALDTVCAGHTVTRDMLRPGLQDGFPWHRPHQTHLPLDTADAWWDAIRPVFVHAYEQAGVDHYTATEAAPLVPRIYTDPQYWTVFDDTRPALIRLHEAGWRHVIVSNHVPELPQLICDLGLADLFAEVFTSAATGYEKPHTEMFTLALASAGTSSRVWMVGDSPSADIAGAEQVGIPALLVRSGKGCSFARAAGLGRVDHPGLGISHSRHCAPSDNACSQPSEWICIR